MTSILWLIILLIAVCLLDRLQLVFYQPKFDGFLEFLDTRAELTIHFWKESRKGPFFVLTRMPYGAIGSATGSEPVGSTFES